MEVRERIRLLRQYKKLSLPALAERTDISISVLSRMETGQHRITVDDVVVIASALNVPVEAFFYDEKMFEIIKGG